MTRMKLADLTSAVGALVLGAGLGALFPRWFATEAGLLTAIGLMLHGFGMWDKHRLEAQAHPESGRWVLALYWVCCCWRASPCCTRGALISAPLITATAAIG